MTHGKEKVSFPPLHPKSSYAFLRTIAAHFFPRLLRPQRKLCLLKRIMDGAEAPSSPAQARPWCYVCCVHRRPPTYKIQQCIHAGSGLEGREEKLSFLAPAPPPVHVRITLCANRLCAGAMRAVSGAGAGGTFYEAVSQFSISSLFLSSLGSFQRAVAKGERRKERLADLSTHAYSIRRKNTVCQGDPGGRGERGPLGKSTEEHREMGKRLMRKILREVCVHP